jgi:sugar phosphate isomerase/epimerase
MFLNRRKFLTLTAMSGTTAMLNPLEAFNVPLNPVTNSQGFELLILATNWGFAGGWEEFCAKIKSDGYDGAEVWFPGDEKSRTEFLRAAEKHKLRFAFLFGGSDRDPKKQLQEFKSSVSAAAELKPLFINSHSGRDHFSIEQNKPFIDFTTELHAKTGVPIYHETHRGRILYSAPVSRTFLDQHPDLRLTLDISHWCNVHESLLDDQAEVVNLALSRTDHIHTRVGHAEGPQVNDPRAPEWKDAVNAHFAWWDKVVQQKKKEGKRLTMMTEFGPVDYLPALPFTRQPVANQWEINKYMLTTLRTRYGK